MRFRVATVACWVVVVVAALGALGGVLIGSVVGLVVWVLVGGAAGLGLLRLRSQRTAGVQAEIAARAECENELYLNGDTAGLYGQYRTKD